MQFSKPSHQGSNDSRSSHPDTSSQDSPEIRLFHQLLQECSYHPCDDLFGSIEIPLLEPDFSASDSAQLPEIPSSTQAEVDIQQYELTAHGPTHIDTPTLTRERSTPDDNPNGPITPVFTDPSDTIGLFNADSWQDNFASYTDQFDEPISPTRPLADLDHPLYPAPLTIQSPHESVAEEEYHGNDLGHGDQELSPHANSGDSEMSDWRRQSRTPAFSVNLCSPQSSPGEEIKSRRRRRRRRRRSTESSQETAAHPKRQRSSREILQTFLDPDMSSQDRSEEDLGFGNQFMLHNHSQVRTAPGAIAVVDLFQAVTPEQEQTTRRKRAHSICQEGHRCPYCRCPFTRERDIPRHIIAAHGEKVRFYCEYCDKSYTRNDSLGRHYRSCPNKPRDP